jgi:hypothetical protein
VTALAFRMWRREVSRLTGLTSNSLRALALAAVALSLVLSVGAAFVVSDLAGDLSGRTLPDLTLMSRSVSNGIVLVGLVLGAVFGLLTSETTALETFVHLGGGSRWDRFRMLGMPTLLVSEAAAIAVTAPLLVVLPSALRTAAVGWLIPLSCAVCIVANAFGLALQRGLVLLVRRARVPHVYATATGSAVVVGLGLALCYPALSPSTRTTMFNRLWIGDALSTIGQEDVSPAVVAATCLVLFSAALVAALLLWANTGSSRELGSAAEGLVGVPAGAAPSSAISALIWFQVVCQVRAASTLLAAGGVVATTVVLVLGRDHELVITMVFLPALIAGSTGLHAVGSNLASSWFVWLADGSERRWAVSKIVGSLIVATALGLPYAIASAVWIDPGVPAAVGVQVYLPVFAGSLLAGSLLPVTTDQPLTMAMSGALSFAVVGGGLLLIDRLLSIVAKEATLFGPPLFALVAIGATAFVLSRLRTESLIRVT